MAIDSSGLKVYGEGEWQVRQHGASQRRTWRTVHWAVDCASGLVMAVAVTEARVHDSPVVEPLLAAVGYPLASVAADGAYDRRRVDAALVRHSAGVRIAIPPRRDARIGQHGNCKAPPHPRDENLRFYSSLWASSLEGVVWVWSSEFSGACGVSVEAFVR